MNWRQAIESTLERHSMLRNANGRRVGVAVSGGADSVFLLRALAEMGLAAAVLHANHRRRGAESDHDEVFVRELGAELGLPVHVAALPVLSGNIEQETRRARYDFFAAQINDGCCHVVATGHTLEDQAETVLSRFLRGAGTAGLSAILPVTRAGIIRPLLDIHRSDIRQWLAEGGFPWREDSSNADTNFLRNRIRHEIMPELSRLNPSLPSVLASTADWAGAEEEYWRAELDRIGPQHLQPNREAILIQTGPFLELPVALGRRLLRRAIETVRGSLRGIDFRHVEAIRGMMHAREGSGRVQLPGLDIYRSFDWLRLAPPGIDSRLDRDFETALPIPGALALPERRIALEMELVTGSRVYNKQMDALDWGAINGAGSLLVRNWRPGDSYAPAGASGAEKIKTLFQDSRIPLWERRTWPVVVMRDGEREFILWSRRFGVADRFQAGPETGKVLLLRETGESNTPLPASIKVCAQARSAVRGSSEVL